MKDGVWQPLNTVQAALDNYFAAEIVECNAEPCTRCGCVRFWKKESVTITPDVLILCLKRWATHETPLLHTVLVTDVITFQGIEYHLRSVIVHLGESAQSGHYITVAKHTTESNSWWIYDDESRREASVDERSTMGTYFQQNMNSYVITYEKSM